MALLAFYKSKNKRIIEKLLFCKKIIILPMEGQFCPTHKTALERLIDVFNDLYHTTVNQNEFQAEIFV